MRGVVGDEKRTVWHKEDVGGAPPRIVIGTEPAFRERFVSDSAVAVYPDHREAPVWPASGVRFHDPCSAMKIWLRYSAGNIDPV